MLVEVQVLLQFFDLIRCVLQLSEQELLFLFVHLLHGREATVVIERERMDPRLQFVDDVCLLGDLRLHG